MSFQQWWPKTKRNKIALCIAIFSLLMMIVWNLGPRSIPNDNFYQNYSFYRTFAYKIWPDIYKLVSNFRQYDSSKMNGLIASLSLMLLVCLQLTMIPLWRIFSQSKVLRFIPAVICLIGFSVFGYNISKHDYYTWQKFYPYYLILLNFLTTIISLMTLKNEAAVNEHHTS
jgi:hypothetical protein